MINSMAHGVLAVQGARPSAYMVLTKFSPKFSVLAPDGLKSRTILWTKYADYEGANLGW